MSRPAALSPAPGHPPSDTAPDGSAPRPARTAWIRLTVLVVLLVAFASWVTLGGADLLREVRQRS